MGYSRPAPIRDCSGRSIECDCFGNGGCAPRLLEPRIGPKDTARHAPSRRLVFFAGYIYTPIFRVRGAPRRSHRGRCCQSERNVVIRSTRKPRRTGSTLATNAAVTTKSTAPQMPIGSTGLTPKSMLESMPIS